MKRKTFRKLKRKKFKEILKVSETELNIDLDNSEFIAVFNKVWPILKPVLEYAEMLRITRDKVDKIIRTLIEVGDRIYGGNDYEADQSRFIKFFDQIWRYIEIILKIAKTFTNNKTDKVIDDIIEIGEWIANNKTNQQND